MQRQPIKKPEQTHDADSYHISPKHNNTNRLNVQCTGMPLYLQRSRSQLLQRQPLEEEEEVLQTKLNIGAPNDKYEQEADRVADEVMGMPDAAVQRQAEPEEEEEEAIQAKPITNTITPLVQRQAEPEEEEEEALQAKPVTNTITPSVQRQVEPEEEEEEAIQAKPIADAIAPLVQRQVEPEEEEEEAIQAKPIADAITPLVQRQVEPEEEEEEAIQAKPIADTITPLVQRQAEPEEEEEEAIQAKPIASTITPSVQRQVEPEEEEEEPIQTKSIANNPTALTNGLQNKIQSIKGGGQPLLRSEQKFFETRFGTDFSSVRVHSDPSSNQIAHSINARAFTHGRDVVFGAGQYSPGSHSGRSLLAHELTHVVQQSGQQRFVQRDLADELGVTPTLDLLARQLEDDQEDDAISTFGTLPGPDTDAVLRNRRWRNLAMSAFNNEEMHRAMMATGQRGLLFSKLLWEFDEGTNWNQLRPLIHRAPRPQRRQVITQPWFRSQFVSECGNETMGIAVRLLGPPLRNQLDWMIEEGVDETQFSRLIEETIPTEMHAASSDTTLMTRLRGELGDSSPVVSALEAARYVSPTGTTRVGPRWSSADVRMLSTQTARIGIISPRMSARVPGAITALSGAHYTAFRNLLTAAGSDTERAFICKALVSGRTIAEITTFAGTIHGSSDAWLLQNLNVFQVSSAADTAAGAGLIQQFVNSCGPASVQMIRADSDPIYALSLNSAGPIGSAPPSAVSNPASITNAPLATEQSTMLTTHAAAGTGIAPINRVTPHPRGGAWVEADMNARRAATGVQYTRRNIGSGFTIDDALAVINVNLGMGVDVPIIVGSGPGSYAHYVVVVRKAGNRYQIHDVWTGQTVWRTARNFRSSQLNLPSRHVAISAMAEPSLVR